MTELRELKNKKKDLILNLDEDDLEAYILSLSQKYYTYMIKGDASGMRNIVESLDYIVEIYELRYKTISDYITYCLLISGNKIFKKVFNLNGRLWIPNEKSLASDGGFNSLMYSLEASRMKIINEESDVKELYDMVLNNGSIPEEIVDKVIELYNAFKIFNYGGEL